MSDIKEGMIRQTLCEWAREEGAFAVALGMKRAKLSSLRKEYLEEGVHWGRKGRKGGGGGRITYYVGGEAKMRGLVALLVGVSVVEVVEEVGREEPEVMEVVRVYPVNRRLVECLRGDGGKVRVNVGDNANLMKGMVLKARPPWGDGRLWVLVGARPRSRGKW